MTGSLGCFSVWPLRQPMVGWYQQGLDVQALLPRLSVYLGHVHPQESYWYLTAAPELLSAAAQRFETFAQAGGMRHA